RRLQRDLLDDAHRAFLRLHGKGRSKGQPSLLARHLLLIGARVWPEARPAVAPLGLPCAALAGAAGALLLPGFLPAARHLAAGLGLMGALAIVRLLTPHRLVQHGLVHGGVEDGRRQLERAGLLAVTVVNRGG